MTDDVTHLRALLAEQTTRAERAEAACAELRAALERHVCQHVECSPIETHAGCHARHTLSRPDLGAGMVAVPRGVVERLVADLSAATPYAETDEGLARVTRDIATLASLLDGGKVGL